MDEFNFDDDVFSETVERKAIPLIKNYQAKIDEDGWFHDIGDIRERMTEKLGPGYVKSAIEHDYLHRRYKEALEKTLIYLDMIENDDRCTILGTREINEIGVLCGAKLGQWDLVEKLLDAKQTTFEVGSLLLRGRYYPKCGRTVDGIANLVLYCQHRKRDYQAWRLMAEAYWHEREKGEMMLHLAHLCMTRSLRVMTTFPWRLDIPLIRNRFQNEKTKMEQFKDTIEQAGGQLDAFVAWMEAPSDDSQAQRLKEQNLDGFSWEDLDWTRIEWLRRLDDSETGIDDHDVERAVKEM
ncbi:hypothetical protein DM01DRAFT_1324684, partial [Hesseltinella vesiculosa]